ncbi:MAG TPA: hypothetical protein VIM79_05405 [Niastella sp.]
MKTLCIRVVLWVFSVLFIQHAAQAQGAPASQQPQATSVNPLTLEQEKQKKPKVKKQWRIAIDADAGIASPNNAALSDIFKAGINGSLGIKTAFLNNKLWVRPHGGLKYYFKNVEMGETRREAFRTWKAGIELQYNAYTLKKFSFYPILKVNQNWSSSQFTKLADDKANSTAVQTTANVLKGTGYSFGGGIMVVHSGDLYVKLDYEYYKPDLKVSPDLIREMLAAGYLMPDHKVYDCSSINLSIGVNLNFKK